MAGPSSGAKPWTVKPEHRGSQNEKDIRRHATVSWAYLFRLIKLLSSSSSSSSSGSSSSVDCWGSFQAVVRAYCRAMGTVRPSHLWSSCNRLRIIAEGFHYNWDRSEIESSELRSMLGVQGRGGIFRSLLQPWQRRGHKIKTLTRR